MKETKIEKLILDLSNRWECTPQEAVDRLNSMNESEINKLINSMTKKFQMGGRAFGPNIPYGNYRIINKETVILPKKSGITQTQIDSVYNAEQEAFQKRASESIPELEQKIVDLRDKMGWDKSQRVKPIPGIKMPVTNSDPQYSNSRNQKFENGGFIDCLRNGGSISKCKCGCDKIAKADEGKKLRIDRPGYAYTMPNGIDVLTQDAVGLQPAPGSSSTVKGSSPEFETQRRRRTDKGGNVKYDLYKVFVNDGDHYGPVARYTTKRTLWDPRTWFATLLEEQRAKEMQTAYDVNNLKCGGEINQLPKQKKNYLKK